MPAAFSFTIIITSKSEAVTKPGLILMQKNHRYYILICNIIVISCMTKSKSGSTSNNMPDPLPHLPYRDGITALIELDSLEECMMNNKYMTKNMERHMKNYVVCRMVTVIETVFKWAYRTSDIPSGQQIEKVSAEIFERALKTWGKPEIILSAALAEAKGFQNEKPISTFIKNYGKGFDYEKKEQENVKSLCSTRHPITHTIDEISIDITNLRKMYQIIKKFLTRFVSNHISVSETFIEAIVLNLSGDLANVSKAEKLFQTIKLRDKNNVDDILEYAVAQSGLGNYTLMNDTLVKSYKQLVDNGEDSKDYYEKLVESFILISEYGEAVKYAEKALVKYPKYTPILKYMVDVQYRLYRGCHPLERAKPSGVIKYALFVMHNDTEARVESYSYLSNIFHQMGFDEVADECDALRESMKRDRRLNVY